MRQAYIPTVSELQTFASLARLGTTARAAADLGLTQSAVSRAIKSLEERLGVRLFHRVRQRLALSDAGRAFRRDAEAILERLDEAAVSVMAFGAHDDVLRLAVLPTFCNVWLLPRLGAFRTLAPNVTFDIVARLDPVDFETGPFDAAIQRSHMRPAGALSLPLMEERLVVVASPALIAARPVPSDTALADWPLLQQATRPSLWMEWFRPLGLDARSVLKGARFEHFEMVIGAAIAGLGIALVPEILVEADITAGRLVLVSSRTLSMDEPYSLIFPPRSASEPKFVAFRDWLATQCQIVMPSK